MEQIPVAFFRSVILVDDGSEEQHQSALRKLEQKYKNLKLILNMKNKGAGLCREQGMEVSSADYILFSDDDISFSEGFCKSLLCRIKRDRAAVVGGTTMINADELGAQANNYIHYNDWFCKIRVRDRESKKNSTLPFVWNPMLIDRLFYNQNKIRFYPYEGNGYREESDHQLQAIAAGGKVVYEPGAYARHHSLRNEGGAWGKGNQFRRLLRWYFWSIYNDWIFFGRHSNTLNRINGTRKPRLIRFLLSVARNATVLKGLFHSIQRKS